MSLNGKDHLPRKKTSYPLLLMAVGGSLVILAAIIYSLTNHVFVFASSVSANDQVEQNQSAASQAEPDQAEPGGNQSYLTRPVEVNFIAPDLSLKNLQGEQVALSDYLGKVVLVNNWATWCPPCRAEMPALNDYFQKHKDQGFTLIAIEAGDPAQDVQQFIDAYHLTFHIWLDPNGDALSAFHNGDLPSSYVIDKSGTVRFAWVGETGTDMLEDYITPMLEQ